MTDYSRMGSQSLAIENRNLKRNRKPKLEGSSHGFGRACPDPAERDEDLTPASRGFENTADLLEEDLLRSTLPYGRAATRL